MTYSTKACMYHWAWIIWRFIRIDVFIPQILSLSQSHRYYFDKDPHTEFN